MKRTLTLALAVAMALASGAQNVRHLSARAALTESTATTATIDSIIPVYITFDPAALDRRALESLGARLATEIGGTATARIPVGVLSSLGEIEGVKYVQTAYQARQMLDIAAPEVGITEVRVGTGLPSPYTGKGVIIGVVDAGFDYNHAAFRGPDGSLRISRVWEQSTTSGTAPEKYGYGTELTTPEEISAAEGDIYNNSHGTHVTAIAAGSDTWLDSSLLGMAPEAEIVLVSLTDAGMANVNISDAIDYIFSYADEVGKPCVVNLSLGANGGPHDGTSTFDNLADAMQGPGRLIIGASGNNRQDKFHVMKRFESADDSPLSTFIDFRKNSSGGEIEVWGSEGSEIEVALLAYSISNGEAVERVVVYPADQEVANISLGRNVSGEFIAAAETSPLNGKPHVALTSAVKSIRTGYAVAIEVTPKGAGQVDIWADDIILNLTSKGIEGFEEPGTAPTLCEIGGTARRILTVGAYTTRSDYYLFNDPELHHLNETDGDISSFSSFGPTADGRMKPQVTAPGCFISSAISNYDGSGTLFISQVHDDGVRNHMFGYMQGTSMATPMVTGIVATWLQAYPELDPEQLAEVVEKTARADAFTIGLPDNNWGYGKIDALAGAKECVVLSQAGGIATPAPNAPALSFDSDNLYVGASDALVTVWSTTGRCLLTRKVDGAETYIPLAGLPRGVYILSVSAPGGTTTMKFAR